MAESLGFLITRVIFTLAAGRLQRPSRAWASKAFFQAQVNLEPPAERMRTSPPEATGSSMVSPASRTSGSGRSSFSGRLLSASPRLATSPARLSSSL